MNGRAEGDGGGRSFGLRCLAEKSTLRLALLLAAAGTLASALWACADPDGADDGASPPDTQSLAEQFPLLREQLARLEADTAGGRAMPAPGPSSGAQPGEQPGGSTRVVEDEGGFGLARKAGGTLLPGPGRAHVEQALRQLVLGRGGWGSLEVKLPRRLGVEAPWTLALQGDPGWRLALQPEGVSAVAGATDGQLVRYGGAFGAGIDALVTMGPKRLEWSYLLRHAAGAAQREFALRVDVGAGLVAGTDPSGRVIFSDRITGTALLRVGEAQAEDQRGRRRAVAVRFEGGRLVVALGAAAAGMTFPVLLDPAIEVVEGEARNGLSAGPTSPSERWGQALASDASRGTVLLFGGSSRDDTWEWDGLPGTWSLRHPLVGPSARSFHAMAYDAARGKVLLFGGARGAVNSLGRPLGDTWEWDGTAGTWTERHPAAGPTARSSAALAYDTSRGKIVLFGGRDASGGRNDTWEWDGLAGTWTQRLPAASPPGRLGHALAYDASRGRVLLYGGLVNLNGRFLNDTWEWDGGAGTWTQRRPAVSPVARWFHALVYDPSRSKVLLFGGADGTYDHNDTWEWDGAAGTWTQRSPEVSPPAPSLATLAYDVARGKVLLFFGADGRSRAASTWEWDGNLGTWTQRRFESSPSPRVEAGLAYDASRGKVLLFGGVYQGNPLNDTWEWDGTQTVWTRRRPLTSPAARYGPGIVHDASRGKVLLFGGIAYSSVYFDDTWEWDGVAGTWTQVVPAQASPSERYGPGMAYDASRRTVLLFSGVRFGQGQPLLSDTWEWDGAAQTWTLRSPATQPPARCLSGLAYDASRGTVVLFGGAGSSDDLNDTWEWNGTAGTWTRRDPATSPPARNLPGLVYDASRSKVLLFGGFGPQGSLGDTWEWDGSAGTWTASVPRTSPTARSGHGQVYDASRGKALLFGGRSMNGDYLGDTWEWDGSAGTWAELEPYPRLSRASGAQAWFSGRDALGRLAETTFVPYPGSGWRPHSAQESAIQPPVRTDGAAAYDPAHRTQVLFGGRDAQGVALGDLWRLDGQIWSLLEGGDRPAPRHGMGAAFDLGSARALFFGGTDGAQFFADTWLLGDPAQGLVQASPAHAPSARADAGAAYDPLRRRLVLFGGRDGAEALDDTWVWDGRDWSRVQTATQPSRRYGQRLVYSDFLGKVLCVGGTDGTTDHGDLWSFDGRTWSQLQVDGAALQPRAFHLVVVDGEAVRVYGGETHDARVVPDPWSGTVRLQCASDADCADPLRPCLQGSCGADQACSFSHRPAGTVCRVADGPCDADDQCTGSSADCPVSYQPPGTVCLAADGPCDVDDTCTGSSTDCPASYQPQGTVCLAAAGPCDVDDTCTGDAADCPAMYQAQGTVCLAAEGPCDADDTCTGSSSECPVTYRPADTLCSAAACMAGMALEESRCTGAAVSCPEPVAQACAPFLCAGTVCADRCVLFADCADGNWCGEDGSCVALEANGAPCTVPGQCTTNSCVDGYCCDTACTGQCEACDGEQQEGTCSPVAGPPHGERAACTTDGSSCGGECDGEQREGCSYPEAETSCAPAACEQGVAVPERSCNGEGTCPAGQPQDCVGFACVEGHCLGDCRTQAECAAGYYCAAGLCTAQLTDGGVCSAAEQCRSGFCVDHRCCGSACGAPCAACDVAGSEGVCTPVLGQPHGGRPACPGLGPCRGSCDGVHPEACLLPGGETQCHAPSCERGLRTKAAVCDGQGSCSDPDQQECGAYACEADDGCRVACDTDQQCAAGSGCLDGRCVVEAGADSKSGPSASQGSGACAMSTGNPSLSLLAWALLLALSLSRRRGPR